MCVCVCVCILWELSHPMLYTYQLYPEDGMTAIPNSFTVTLLLFYNQNTQLSLSFQSNSCQRRTVKANRNDKEISNAITELGNRNTPNRNTPFFSEAQKRK